MAKVLRPSVVLIKDGKILVLKSKYSSGEFYLLPGGALEKNESIGEAAVRETKEETNLDIALKKLLYIQKWINKQREKHVVYLIFLGEIISGKETHLNDPCLDKGNIQALEWIPIEKLDTIKFYPKDIIPLLKEDFKSNFSRTSLVLEPDITDS